MTEKWILETSVAFGDVDRDNVLTLQGVFQLLQEAAIAHANQYDTGTGAMETRGESWVLNRMAVEVARYPHYGEALRLETWSSGIRGFKGYRDFRVFDSTGRGVIAGSSLWIYVNVRTKAIIRVPREVADKFPVGTEGVFCPDLESLDLAAPDPATARACTITLRYSDIDANLHVNNTAYLDLLQSALAATGASARPQSVRIKYARGIPAETAAVEVRLAPPRAAGLPQAFSILAGTEVFAQGEVS
jgi:acyl-ACP thioesterase